tara:strand:+ start:348 stop:644 length:297 start_codon:yes stop_codon:yes gene_type:complete
MLIFKDLEFKRKEMGGVGASHTFENGITISVQASKGNYSTPREDLTSSDEFVSFEVAVMDGDGDFITKNHFQNHGNDVRGWMDRADISILMIKIQFNR